MGRQPNGNCIVKLDKKGIEHGEFRKIQDAADEANVGYHDIREAIKNQTMLLGFYYKYELKRKDPDLLNNQYPWESSNGMFNIEGWKKVCF